MTRLPIVGGSFYPNNPEQIKNDVNKYLSEAKISTFQGKLKALIAPHAGYIYSGPTAGYAFRLLQEMTPKPKKIILIGPSHFIYVAKPVYTKEDFWATPLGKVPLFYPFNDIVYSEKAHAAERCLELQLPFLQEVLEGFSLCPVLINEHKYSEELSEKILNVLDDDTLIVVSSDLSHFYSLEDAEKLDSHASSCITKLNIEEMKNGIEACGLASIITLMHIAKKVGWSGQLLKYQTSANITKDRSNVVGYGSYSFFCE